MVGNLKKPIAANLRRTRAVRNGTGGTRGGQKTQHGRIDPFGVLPLGCFERILLLPCRRHPKGWTPYIPFLLCLLLLSTFRLNAALQFDVFLGYDGVVPEASW